jgi:hypothetical protein
VPNACQTKLKTAGLAVLSVSTMHLNPSSCHEVSSVSPLLLNLSIPSSQVYPCPSCTRLNDCCPVG